MLILQVKRRFAQLPVLMEKLIITKGEEGQDLDFHLMVILELHTSANLMMASLKIVS